MIKVKRTDQRKIGQILEEDFKISKEIINKILSITQQTKKKFIKVALEYKLVPKEILYEAFLKQYDLGHKILTEALKKGLIDLDTMNLAIYKFNQLKTEENIIDFMYKNKMISEKLYKRLKAKEQGYEFFEKIEPAIKLSDIKVPYSVVKQGNFFPVKENYNEVVIAIARPVSWEQEQIIKRYFKNKKIRFVLTTQEELNKNILIYENYQKFKEIFKRIKKELNENVDVNAAQGGKSAIVELIEYIIVQGIKNNTSDIHIEPTETVAKVRFRKFGTLYKYVEMDKDIYTALASRMKIMAKVDVSEKRKPQDGAFSMTVDSMEFDFRFSSLPTVFGESIVLRILDKRNVLKKITDIGITKENLDKILAGLSKPNGIFLVTGPTGSGKSTTLYASLNATTGEDVKVITVEDPVEYKIDGIQQVNVNPNVGLTFPAALKSILRQDPDIIMIGEIRDKETLEIAIKAALTGHLVLSTLHTNDAIGAISRMIDMGAEPFMVAASLVGVEAQRLVKTVCPYCKEEYKPDEVLLKQVEKYLPANAKFYKGKGCDKCDMTGYSGRTLITEVFLNDSELEEMIAKNMSKAEIKKYLKEKRGYKNMFMDGLHKALQGITTLEEVFAKANIND